MTHYVYLPLRPAPVGGIIVLHQVVHTLRSAGVAAAPLYDTADVIYPFAEPFDDPVYVCPDIARALSSPRLHHRLKARLTRSPLPKRAHGAHMVARPGRGDTVVLPEISYGALAPLFPQAKVVVAVQSVDGIVRAVSETPKEVTQRVAGTLAFSDACAAATEVSALPAPWRITLEVGQAGQTFHQEKKRQVAYLVRKMPHHMAYVVAALKAAPEFAGYTFQPISGVPPARVAEIMNESLFFLNVAELEGFGLPPAEAMLAGCITVGYPAVGSSEFLTPDFGVPVETGNAPAMVAAARAVAAEYENDPNRLDQMRQRASTMVRGRYSKAAFEDSVRGAWDHIDALTRGE